MYWLCFECCVCLNPVNMPELGRNRPDSDTLWHVYVETFIMCCEIVVIYIEHSVYELK